MLFRSQRLVVGAGWDLERPERLGSEVREHEKVAMRTHWCPLGVNPGFIFQAKLKVACSGKAAGANSGESVGIPTERKILEMTAASMMNAIACMPLVPHLGQVSTSTSKTRAMSLAQPRRLPACLGQGDGGAGYARKAIRSTMAAPIPWGFRAAAR